jgi:predicted AlkP superfamily phosphohydrolase/phosphomutase
MSGEGAASGRVLMIGIDAAEPRLIEAWTEDGTLPNLASLRGRGAYGRLASSARWLVGSPWPTFYTGTGPEAHGLYHYLMWDPDRMEAVRPGREDFPSPPFWRRLGPDRRVVAVDVPFVFPPEPFDGVELNGWATHDRLGPPSTHPAELLGAIERKFGPPPLKDEVHRPFSVARLLEVRDELVHATEAVTGVAEELARRESWDLFLAAYSATHRGGHKLWIDPVSPPPDDAAGSELRSALRDIYVTIDRGVGRLVEAAGPDTTVLVFALHGMGPNTCHTQILGEMVRRILAPAEEGGPTPVRTMGVLKRLREMVPLAVRNEVKRRLPVALQDRLTSFWRTGGLDWSTTRAFCPVADLQGYVRINLAGREAEGIVEPGAEYDALCAEIVEGLQSFVDADTGEPIVRAVRRSDQLFPDGPCRDGLPDLLVDWTPTSVLTRREVRSARFGTIAWPDPGSPPDGRSGNHRTEGWLIGAGPGFEPGRSIDGDIRDLAPTALDRLGLAAFPEMQGRSLAEPDTGGGG